MLVCTAILNVKTSAKLNLNSHLLHVKIRSANQVNPAMGTTSYYELGTFVSVVTH